MRFELSGSEAVGGCIHAGARLQLVSVVLVLRSVGSDVLFAGWILLLLRLLGPSNPLRFDCLQRIDGRRLLSRPLLHLTKVVVGAEGLGSRVGHRIEDRGDILAEHTSGTWFSV